MRSSDRGPAVVCGAGIGAVAALELSLAEPELVIGTVLVEPPLLSFLPEATDRLAADVATVREAVAESGRDAALDAYLAGRLPALGAGRRSHPARPSATAAPARRRPCSPSSPAVPAWERSDAELAAATRPSLIAIAADSPPLLAKSAIELARVLGPLRPARDGAGPTALRPRRRARRAGRRGRRHPRLRRPARGRPSGPPRPASDAIASSGKETSRTNGVARQLASMSAMYCAGPRELATRQATRPHLGQEVVVERDPVQDRLPEPALIRPDGREGGLLGLEAVLLGEERERARGQEQAARPLGERGPAVAAQRALPARAVGRGEGACAIGRPRSRSGRARRQGRRASARSLDARAALLAAINEARVVAARRARPDPRAKAARRLPRTPTRGSRSTRRRCRRTGGTRALACPRPQPSLSRPRSRAARASASCRTARGRRRGAPA